MVPTAMLEEESFPGVGKVNVWPDWTSLRTLDDSHAYVQCGISENRSSLPAHLDFPADSSQRCPRACLNRVLEVAKLDFSLSFLAGFELEFYLQSLNHDTKELSVPSEGPLWTWSTAAFMRGAEAECIEACMLALEDAGIAVEQGLSESSHQQYEISIGPLPVMAAVDSALCAQEIIKNVALSQGFRACFRPKPFQNLDGSGLHLHLSLHEETNKQEQSRSDQTMTIPQNIEEHQIDKRANQFLAGILTRLVALWAFSMPSPESYDRSSDPWVMGRHVAWGENNIFVPINQITDGHWEIRCLDWTANIYLAVTAYISAGLLGIKAQEALKCSDQCQQTPKMDGAERDQLRTVQLLPTRLEETLEKLAQSRYSGLKLFMGKDILDLYLVMKEKEQKYLQTLTNEAKDTIFALHI